MNIDLLFDNVASKGHVCVGLDTSADYVPELERKKAGNDAQAVLEFNKALIDATYDVCACFKVQIAYYEEMGIEGLKAYIETLKYIKQKNCLSIADIKRGDIADTAQRYAAAHFAGEFEADFVTISPYMGMDSVDPWLKEAQKSGKGAFVLMRTSNKGMRDFQWQTIRTDIGLDNHGDRLATCPPQDSCPSDQGSNKMQNPRLYNIVGDKMTSLANSYTGTRGYGIFGVVVGCTEKEEAEQIRKTYGSLFFLIPGYGAQGGAAQDVALLLKDGNGGVVNASRSIITAWKNEKTENTDNLFAAAAARSAVIKMRDEIREAIK